MEPILKVTDLSKVFSRAGKNEFYAVDHVSFSVCPGEILGVVGESGSGKSTIAKLITRQIDPTTGRIEIDGQDVTKLSGRALIPVYAKIQMVFQSPAGSFDPRRTLGDGICESLRNKGVPKAEREAKARSLLEQCGLPGEFLERYPHQVSGGQCQRAAIARALMCDPRVLIFDEATSALDVTMQKQIIELLQQLQKEKKSGAGTAVLRQGRRPLRRKDRRAGNARRGDPVPAVRLRKTAGGRDFLNFYPPGGLPPFKII